METATLRTTSPQNELRTIQRGIARVLVQDAAQRARMAFPEADDQGAIQRGVAMILRGHVRNEGGVWIVHSERAADTEYPQPCTCPAAKYSAQVRCKHTFAVWLVRAADIALASARLATHKGHGQWGVVWQRHDASIVWQAMDEDTLEPLGPTEELENTQGLSIGRKVA